MKKIKFQRPLQVVCSFLVLFAPIMLNNTGCCLLWGEPECPEVLKQSK